MKNQILEKLRNKRLDNLDSDLKDTRVKDILLKIKNELEQVKDRFLFVVPDIDVVNPLVKFIYDIALEAKNNGYNVKILHEKEGFKPLWLLNTISDYNVLEVEYLSVKAGKKTERLKTGYKFRMSDSIFIADINLEMIQDLMQDKQFALIQKTMIVTGYSGLYTLNPGYSLEQAGIDNTIIFDTQVYQDYQMLFPKVRHYKIAAHKIQNYSNVNLTTDEFYVKEPYILISSVGNQEKINQIVNIFYNRYPFLNFIKIKTIARKNLGNALLDVKNAILFLDTDRHYCTTFNSSISWNYKTPYLSTNGHVENSEITNNLLSPISSLDIFQIVENIKTIVVENLYNTDRERKENLVPNQEILNSLQGVYEIGIKDTLKQIRDIKVERLGKIIG